MKCYCENSGQRLLVLPDLADDSPDAGDSDWSDHLDETSHSMGTSVSMNEHRHEYRPVLTDTTVLSLSLSLLASTLSSHPCLQPVVNFFHPSLHFASENPDGMAIRIPPRSRR